jgi:hypothetical protein
VRVHLQTSRNHASWGKNVAGSSVKKKYSASTLPYKRTIHTVLQKLPTTSSARKKERKKNEKSYFNRGKGGGVVKKNPQLMG